MTRIEAFIDAVVAPAPPLPAVHETAAAGALTALLAHSPRLNAVALGATAVALGAARRPREARLRRMRRLQHAMPALRPLVEGARALAALSYYGDERVRRCLP